MKKDNGLSAWETNATFWDRYMGDESNFFHRELVRPFSEELLDVKAGDLVLDIACGNGNFSKRLAENGADVIAFDYSPKMIELAKKRRKGVLDKVHFGVCDATSYDDLLNLKQNRPFDKAIANMAIMDIADIEPLMNAVYKMLVSMGVFVFSTFHPCFTYPDQDYFSSRMYKGEAIAGQPVLQNYYHRSMEDIFHAAFNAGFMIDGFHEVPDHDQRTPVIMIVRLRKLPGSSETCI
ncbi:MAG TPA: class I SAM-dependent methyltransferase [Candidatus Limiplasma sp.]|jgi:ubiquinone/menaquinone biosynthesis C-methylase UbiE|nr:class I SAM-dependent methyltransferase [Candidatus Limiplasma sp.]HPR79435.1 class I SAM-dependent methyltransferase [Candidatus Limiplasma sp.]